MTMRRLSSAQRESLAVLGLQAILLVAIVAVWQVFSGNPSKDAWKFIDDFYFSSPLAIAQALARWWSDGSIFRHVYVTLQETLAGWLIGCAGGMLVGFALGVARRVSRVLNPFIMAIYSIPKLALAPLFLLWFGLGMASKVAFVATIAFFLIFYNTYTGVRQVSRDQLDLLAIMGASRLQAHRMVTLPSAATWVLSALHVTVPYAFVGAVVAEMIAANVGLGYLIQKGAASFQTAELFAAIVVLVVLATVLNMVISLLERSLLRWQSAGRLDSGVLQGV